MWRGIRSWKRIWLREELLEGVCKSRGFVLGGGVLDTERAAHIVLDEFRAGKIARVTLDDPREEKNAPEK